MKAKDVMTSPVVSIEPDASIWQAVRIMLQRHISGLPVIDSKGALVGIVTEGDFLRRAETGTQRRRAALARVPHRAGPAGRRICSLPWPQGQRDHDGRSSHNHRGHAAR